MGYEIEDSHSVFPSLEKAIDFIEVVPISIPRKYSILPLRPKYKTKAGANSVRRNRSENEFRLQVEQSGRGPLPVELAMVQWVAFQAVDWGNCSWGLPVEKRNKKLYWKTSYYLYGYNYILHAMLSGCHVHPCYLWILTTKPF